VNYVVIQARRSPVLLVARAKGVRQKEKRDMPIVMIMEWEGVTPAQYDDVRKLVNWEGEPPKGGLFHAAAFGPTGLRVTDLWETAEDFGRFTELRLMPGVQKIGLKGQPKVEIFPAHALWTPGYKRV
jgi:hypothetical protein